MNKRLKEKLKRKPKGKRVYKWCSQESKRVDVPNQKDAPSDPDEIEKQRKYIRCPTCNKRLQPKAHFFFGEFACWIVPRHKEK